MTQEQKIIRAKVGLAGAGQAARQCQPGLQNDGLFARQLLAVQGALRFRRRIGASGANLSYS
jgi:hypothetical protein